MKKFLDKTKKLIFIKQGGIISSTVILAAMIIISRFFGFLRYRVLAGFFAKEELDIFFASFRLSDLVFEILITGALTSSFIPMFIKFQKNIKELKENISSIINLIGLLLFIFIGIIFFLLDKIIPLITPGFSSEKISEIVFYSRILLIGQLPFLIMGNFLTGIGQANKTFILTAVAPIIYNLGIIIITIAFANKLYLLAPIIGVVLGAFLFFVFQIPLYLSSEFRYQPIIKITTGLKEFFHMIIPRIFSVAVAQIDATIDLVLTTLLGAGSYTVFYLAQHLQLLPVSVLGMAFGQAALPYLSEIYQDRKIEELRKIILDSILNLLFLTIPIASFFIFARTPLVRLFFGGQKFDWEATVQTALTLSYFSLSIPFHAAYYFITRCFYALIDSKTPFIVGFFSVLINTILSIYFIIYLNLPVWSLGISFSLAIIFNVLLLSFLLSLKLNGLNYVFLFKELVKMLLATLISSIISYGLIRLLDGLIFDTSRTINVFLLLLTGMFVYFLLYLFIAWMIDIKEIYLVTKLLLKAKEYQKKVVEIYSSYV